MEISQLLEKFYLEAKKENFPIDEAIYSTAKKDPLMPILYAGNLQSPVCFFARDLGKDEVIAGQPLFGAAGRMVRNGLHQFFYNQIGQTSDDLQKAISNVLLTNTVPYKPIGNKAFSNKIKTRFRPFMEIFLVEFWKGDSIIPLGAEALDWFAPYSKDSAKFENFCTSEQRFIQTFDLEIATSDHKSKSVLLAPLPHPSPLNQKYYSMFPQMLQQRLQQLSSKLKNQN